MSTYGSQFSLIVQVEPADPQGGYFPHKCVRFQNARMYNLMSTNPFTITWSQNRGHERNRYKSRSDHL